MSALRLIGVFQKGIWALVSSLQSSIGKDLWETKFYLLQL